MWFPLQLLSVTCWAGVNVLDSVLVRHYEKRPHVLQWHQSLWTLGSAAVLAILFPVRTDWALLLFFGGMTGYLGDRVFFLALDRIDVSVTNIAWAILGVFLSIGGMLFFGERWTLFQAGGVILVIAGVVYLSLAGKHKILGWNLLYLVGIALLYTPFYLLQKHAIDSGAGVFITFFWMLLGRELLAGSVPLLVPRLRREALLAFRAYDYGFPLLNGLVIALFLSGTLLSAQAYESGFISLVSVVSNVQPFLVLFLAWVLWKLLPGSASKELLTAQSVRVKIISFLVVLAGLILLGATL